MKLFILLYISTILSFQPKPVWTKAELEKANTAKNEAYLTGEEKKVIMLVNLARMDGKKYLQTFFHDFNQTGYNRMKSSDNRYMVSLRNDLDKVKDLPMLQPDRGLWKAADYHAKDSGKNGITGHTSSDGTGFSKRLPRYIKGWSKIAENCSYGYNDAISIVGQLLLDEGVPSLGHRKSIINPDLDYIGVAIAPHSGYRFNCVMDFCAKF